MSNAKGNENFTEGLQFIKASFLAKITFDTVKDKYVGLPSFRPLFQFGCQFPRSLPVFTIVPIVKPGDDATPINACILDTKSDKGYIFILSR
jgi:hypothetical protein